MTAEGRLARGKANLAAGKFLDNSETIAAGAVKEEKPKAVKKETKENAESNK